jgi:hypothetical protein
MNRFTGKQLLTAIHNALRDIRFCQTIPTLTRANATGKTETAIEKGKEHGAIRSNA